MRQKHIIVTGLLAMGLLLLVGPASGRPTTPQAGETTEIISIASDGTQGDEGSSAPSISADGRYVAFRSYANNLVSGDTNRCDNDGDGEYDTNCTDIFVRDRETRSTTRLSVTTSGAQADFHSHDPAISADGRYVAFTSDASNLVGNDTNDVIDVFVHDWQMAHTTRVSVSSEGAQGNGMSGFLESPSISADGRYVAFSSTASNLVPEDANSDRDVFVHDQVAGVTTRVSTDSEGLEFRDDSRYPSISADGRYVAFDSVYGEVFTDTNYTHDVFVHDRLSGETTYASVASDGTHGNALSTEPSISANGRWVAFKSLASNLVDNDTNGWSDIFVHDRLTAQTTRVSVASNGGQADWESMNPAISADGRQVAFESRATNLVPDDTNYGTDIFVHDRHSGVTTRASIAGDGSQAPYGWWGGATPSISAHGGFVAFYSIAPNLVSGDRNNTYDVFLRVRNAPPPPDPVTFNLEASPTEIPPDGESQAMIFLELLDRDGAGIEWEQVRLSILPDHYGDQLGTLLSEVCVTDFHGQCLMYYQAPTATEVYQHGHGAEKVTIEAIADSGFGKEVDIWFTYLKVTDFLPAHGTRNQDWKSATTYAIFDREVNASSVTADTFRVTSSWYYQNGLPCEYNAEASKHVFCLLDLSDPLVHPNASKGLIITSEFKGGPDGILGTDNTFLRRDTDWKVYTTPALSPRIVAAQVSEEADMVGGRPTVVRVQAGLGEDTELDWVEADVSLTDPVGGAVTRQGYRFYPGELGGPLLSRLQGSSANFYSQRGELPFTSTAGTYALAATVEPSNQHNPPLGEPRFFTAAADITVRDLKFNFYGARWVAAFPIAPKIKFWNETYPWEVGETITSLAAQPMGQNSRIPHTRLFPLKDPMLYVATHKVLPVYAHDVPMSSHGQYLAGIVRRNGYLVPVGVDATVMIAPRAWMDEMNNSDPIFHGVAYRTCIIADDAEQVAIAHCLGHIYGLQDNRTGQGTIRGYDLARDRYLNSAYPELGRPLPLMRDDIGNLPAELAGEVWIEVQNYQHLMSVFVAPAPQAAVSGAGAQESTTLAVGGAVIQEQGKDEAGLIDIVDRPARNAAFPGPDGSGDYSLRLHDGSGTLLATHPFSPAFSTLEEGVEYASFLFSFSAPNETRQVDLLHDSAVLASVTASANPPTVSVTQPPAGSYSGATSVTWTATDPDGGDDDLNVSLSYSQDDGATWYPLALSADGPSYTLDTAQFANCQACRIRVVVDDGFHSAQAESAAFSVTNPPQVRVVWPADGEDHAAPYTDVAAVFRDPMNENTIGSSSLSLTDSQGSPVAGSVIYDEETRTAVLIPAAGLGYNRSYTVRLAGTIEDTLGQSLGSDTVWTFRVEQGPLRVFLPVLLR